VSEQSMEQPDVVENESGALDSEPSVVTDEDRLGADPLEDGMDPPEDWSRDIRFGGTRESEQTDTLTERIPQEEPDVGAGELDEPPGRPVAATPAMELDESVDDPVHAVDGVDGVGGEVELGAESAALHVEQER